MLTIFLQNLAGSPIEQHSDFSEAALRFLTSDRRVCEARATVRHQAPQCPTKCRSTQGLRYIFNPSSLPASSALIFPSFLRLFPLLRAVKSHPPGKLLQYLSEMLAITTTCRGAVNGEKIDEARYFVEAPLALCNPQAQGEPKYEAPAVAK
jgi:hypothetical protein